MGAKRGVDIGTGERTRSFKLNHSTQLNTKICDIFLKQLCKTTVTSTTPPPAASILRDTQELEVLLLKERHGVADTGSKDSLEVRTEGRVVVIAAEGRFSDVREGCRRVVEDGCPLLDLFEEVLRVECGITVCGINKPSSLGTNWEGEDLRCSVPHLHLWVCASEAGEGVLNLLGLVKGYEGKYDAR